MADVLVKSKEAIVIVLDVGRSMDFDSEKGPSILHKAKVCVSMILQRKIFSESKDEIALVIFGSHETSNSLYNSGSSEYMHIKVIQELKPVSWELMETVREIEGCDTSADFIKGDALLVAMDLLQNTMVGKKFFSRRILFLSNFDDEFSSDQVTRICEGLSISRIHLNLIGPVALSEEDALLDQFGGASVEQSKSLPIMRHILKEVNGASYSFDEALPALIYYQKKNVQSLPWNANLDIGTNLTIAISAYIKVYESRPKPWKNAFAFKLNAKIEKETSYHLNDEAQTEVPKDKTIQAFRYGTTLVPFTEEDKANMEYKSGEKGMKVLGFTKEENVQRYYYIGDKTMYVFGQKNRELAGVILAPFIQALYETKMVAIVRYVYSARSQPKIGFLAPRIKPKYECLVFIVLPFMEDLRHFIFAPLDADPKNLPTDEQMNAVDELIDSMDLSTAAVDEDSNHTEALQAKSTVNPSLQRMYQCFQHRVFYPDSPMPEIAPHIRSIIEPPLEFVKRSEHVIQRMKRIFPLNEKSTKKRQFTNIFSNGSSVLDEADEKKPKISDNNHAALTTLDDRVTEVGTVMPVEDFQHLLVASDKPEWFKEVCKQLERAVLKFIGDEKVHLYHDKIVMCLCEYRIQSIKKEEPAHFNLFMKSLKGTLISRSPVLWTKIVDEKLGLITSIECILSDVSFQEATDFNTNIPDESLSMDDRGPDDDEESDLLAEL